ncbi:MAG: protein kinase [Pseudolysinimonas sp.]|uniref:protein kinase domain-containing protein n=1 Tax=Pseudolysinimonas sp. TaxID=2680009 RepID=UPI003C738C83
MEDVAGHRVLRSAGRGDRTRLLLGFHEARTVVLKVAAADDPSASSEIDALHRATGDHIVSLEDVSVDEHETVLVLERLPNGTLAELLERRGGLDAGEAVTILAPIATTIDRIHALGVAHGRLSLRAISFRDDGAPTLTGFGGAHLFAAGSPEVVLETVPAVIDDRAGVREIAALVLERVAGERAAAARRVAEAIADAAPGAVAAHLFDLAAPTPVRFDVEDEIVSTRMGDPREPEPVAEPLRVSLPPWLSTLLPEWVNERLAEPFARIAAVWTAWDLRRRRLALGALAGGVTVLVAVAAVPAPNDESPAVAVTPASAPSTLDAPALPDDPVAAAVLLLAARERCLRDLSLLCLDGVVQPDSAAYADDAALIRAVQAGAEYPEGGVVSGEPVLVEQLGDAALLDLPAGSAPASVLLLRTMNGWRIRDYMDATAVTSELD